MSNQHVDEALNDYFSDLLGGSENDTKAVLEPTTEKDINKELSCDIAAKEKSDHSTAAKKATEHQEITTASTEKTVNSGRVNSARHEATQQQYAAESGADSRPKPDLLKNKALARQPVVNATADTVVDNIAHKDHKERLERMLKQVTTLTSSPTTATSTDITSDLAMIVDTDVSTSADTTVATESTTEIQTSPLTSLKAEPLNDTRETNEVQTAEQINSLSETHIETSNETSSSLLFTPKSQWNENGRPEWAQQRFDILLLDVNGLQLAVPLVSLGQIQDIDKEMTPLFGQSDWFMGIQQTPDGESTIRVVNTAKFIMPERYKDQHNYHFVISIDGLRWGLAVDAVKQPISIDPNEIRWRAKRDSRPWMAGMVKDHMCVLLDIPKIGEILQAQDKNRVE